MVGELTFKDGKLTTPNASPSGFAPEPEIMVLMAQVKKDYQAGIDVLSSPYAEFGENTLTPLSVAERDQRAFNSWEESEPDDPDVKWRWRGIRPITRNKIISIAGHFIAAMLYPNFFAQNEQDEEDKDAANLMRDLIIWNVENSNYKSSYLLAVIAGLVNPVAYLEVEFARVIRQVKEVVKGKIKMRDVIDEVLSGFRLHCVPMDEILIGNPYQQNIQEQKFVGRKRLISWDEAKSRYGKHENWKYVQPGVKTIYDIPSNSFFDVYEEEGGDLVDWFIYYNREEDLEVPFINGIYMGKPDPHENLMKHRRVGYTPDNKPVLVPIYPIVKFGYGIINERFYFYKSAVNELGPQQRLVDKMWKMVVDATFLQTIPPLAVVGSQVIKSNIIYPGAITQFRDKDTSITPLKVGSELAGAYNILTTAENDMIQSAKLPQFPQKSGATAFEVSQALQQAKVQLGVFGSMIASAVAELGALMVDVVIQHQTIAEVEEITGGTMRMRYKKFLLKDQPEGGRKVTKVIELTNKELTGSLEESTKILEEEGGLDSDRRIYRVNPTLFRRRKFLVRIDPDQLYPKNELFDKALKLEAFDRMVNNPLIDQEAITRDFLIEPFAKGETEKYMKKEIVGVQGVQPEPAGRMPVTRGTTPGSIVSQITGGSPLAEMVRGA